MSPLHAGSTLSTLHWRPAPNENSTAFHDSSVPPVALDPWATPARAAPRLAARASTSTAAPTLPPSANLAAKLQSLHIALAVPAAVSSRPSCKPHRAQLLP